MFRYVWLIMLVVVYIFITILVVKDILHYLDRTTDRTVSDFSIIWICINLFALFGYSLCKFVEYYGFNY